MFVWCLRKTCLLGFMATTLLLYSCKAPPNLSDLWGEWHGIAHGQEITVEFQQDGDCRLEFLDIETGSRRSFKGEYHTDFTKQPIPVSIRGITELTHALHTIVDFQSDGSLYMSQFSTRWRLRPISFEPDKSLILTKSEQKSQPGTQ